MQSSPRKPLQIGIARNDRMLPLLNHDVSIDGYNLEFVQAEPSEIFWRALKDGEFDVSEMSLAAHAILTSRGENPFVGLPVFTSRMFRHGAVFVSRNSGISSPNQLAGRRIGVPEYQMTAAVWMRGILQDDYGVASASVEWLTGGVNMPGRLERLELRTPPEYRIENIGSQKTLDAMLRSGEIDALISPQIPDSFKSDDGCVRRLFENPRAEETAYYDKTRIFPIMHLLVIRRERHEREPDLAQKLLEAFEQAKKHSFDRLYDGDALHVMLPWLISEIEATMKIMGANYWPYGINENRYVLETFVRHLRNQGLINGDLDIEALFARDVLASTRPNGESS
ncbi:MAG: ABC transporter substrate-binding protein [Hyphomicrobiaceae bacterium]